jgi:hypothetical protein
MSEYSKKPQVPAAIIDISNNDMPTMHVPARDSMFRPDLPSGLEEEEEVLVEYQEGEDGERLEKDASGLLSPNMSLPYEFNQIGDDFGVQNDEVSYAEEDLKTPVSTPDVNAPRDMSEEQEEDGEDELGEVVYSEKNSSNLYDGMIKRSSDEVRSNALKPTDIDQNDNNLSYSLWRHYNGGWEKGRSVSGSAFYEDGKIRDDSLKFFKGDFAVLSSGFVLPKPYECNSVPDNYKEWFMFEGPSWPTVPYYHKVIKDDNISCLAKSYDHSTEDIVDINQHVYGSDWDPRGIEVGDLIYLIPKEWAKDLHERKKDALFEFVCGNTITPNNDGGHYLEVCDPNHSDFLGDIGVSAYTMYCKNSDSPGSFDDTVDEDDDNYNELCDPNSEWYVGRRSGEVKEDDDGRISVSPGEKAKPGETDYRSSQGWAETQKDIHDKRMKEARILQEEEDEKIRKAEEEVALKRASLISELEPHPLTRGWLEVEGQTNDLLFNHDWIRYLSYIGIDDDDIEQIYSHEVLIYEGRTFKERLSQGASTDSFGERAFTGRDSLFKIYPVCYEPIIIDNDIIINVEGSSSIKIKSGNYSLRKCIPEEGGRRVWDPISKRLVAYKQVSFANLTTSVWKDPNDLPDNDIFNKAQPVRKHRHSDKQVTLNSYSSFSSGYDDITIVTSKGSTVSSDYHRARNRLLEMSGVDNLNLILSTGVPENMRCYEGFFNKNEDPCFSGWCMPDALMAFPKQNQAGFDRYSLKYNPYNVDEAGYDTGWEVDTTPWPTDVNGPVKITSTYMRQKMSSSESGGHYAKQLVGLGEEKPVRYEEWPYLSSQGQSVVEFSMPMRIIRKNSRDGSLNREQRLLKTLIDLYEESFAVNKNSIFNYSIYFVLPGEAFSPFQGECNFVKKYYDEYLKLAGGGSSNSILHDFRPKNDNGEVDNHSVEILNKGFGREKVSFRHSGPKFNFNQVEEFYIKWKSAYFD